MDQPTHLKPAHAPDGHHQARFGRVGVLLINLGTPDATDPASMRRYLKEFLSDRRVVEANPLIWWPLLNLVILNTRPKKSGAAYDEIWNRELDESPLRTTTRATAEKLAERLKQRHPVLLVDWAMRYGTPSIAQRLENLKSQGADKILLMPLYPQYAGATTATALDKAFDALKTMRWQPAVRTLPPYHDNPAYINALVAQTGETFNKLDWQPEALLASFHGLPQAYFDAGDPYYCHCMKTARLLREALAGAANWPVERCHTSFQSRFGREEWLRPYTDEEIVRLARGGIKRLVVITPGFAADCLETLEEIGLRAAHDFSKAGGTHFALVPCLNDSPSGIDLYDTLAENELRGWI
ncbi:MAG: ferrochelatase [Alphaproteobacteria bacterium]